MLKAVPWLFLLLPLFCVDSVKAQEPRWEVGFGVGGLYLPDYRGSDEDRGYIVPWPYIVYYRDGVALDREGLRGRISLAPRVSLVVSASAATPVNSSHNEARAGMPDLGFAGEVGPSLQIDVWRGEGRKRLTFELPWRAVIADSSGLEYIGWVFPPRIVLHVPYLQLWPREWDVDLTLGPMFASDRYHDYYYRVLPQYETLTRPAYDAHGGYSGARVSLGMSTRVSRYWFGAYARYENLAGAVFVDSPLVRRDDAFILSAGMAYIFARSEKTGYHE